MKKTILSSFLIFTFIAYIIHVRIIGADAPVVLTPQPDKTKIVLNLPTYNDGQNSTPTPTPIITPVATPKPTTKPITTPTPVPTPKPVVAPPPVVVNTGKYKNGTYTGASVDAYYGNVQVRVVITGGKIADVQFLDYPQDRSTSRRINSRAMPYLISEAISAQDSNVDAVSGASFTSRAFKESLASALSKA